MGQKNKKICHMTSVHRQEDIRIFQKECISLSKSGFDTYLVSFGKTYDKEGVHIIGIERKKTSRLRRILFSAKQIYKKAKEIDADIYHFHDPELLRYGLKLKKSGKKVVFDSHEDVPSQILSKDWIPKLLRKPISSIYKRYESFVIKRIDAVVSATPHIAKTLDKICSKVVVVHNYPKLDDIVFQDLPFEEREAIVCYAGTIDKYRGEDIMIAALRGSDSRLLIAGDHTKSEIDTNIKYIGRLNRQEINDLYAKSVVGLCIFKPTANYFYGKPIKIYEYMAAGLPVVASNFPLWANLIEENNCGICVDPLDPKAVGKACMRLITDRKVAQKMGENGRKAVEQQFNWSIEEKKLIELYKELSF